MDTNTLIGSLAGMSITMALALGFWMLHRVRLSQFRHGETSATTRLFEPKPWIAALPRSG